MKVDRLDYYRNKLRGVPVADLGRAAWTILLDATQEAEADKREACAKVCEQRAYDRFNECGTREQDTGATYYRGAAAEELEARDEEDHDLAAAISARGAK